MLDPAGDRFNSPLLEAAKKQPLMLGLVVCAMFSKSSYA
jgi:hypothetical protein